MVNSLLHSAHGCLADGAKGLVDGGKWHSKEGGIAYVIEAGDADVARESDTQIGQCADELCRSLVVGADYGVGHGWREHLVDKVGVCGLTEPGQWLCLRQTRPADGLSATCQAQIGGSGIVGPGEKAKVAVCRARGGAR